MTKVLKGKIVHQGGELMVEHSPKKIFGELRGSSVLKKYFTVTTFLTLSLNTI